MCKDTRQGLLRPEPTKEGEILGTSEENTAPALEMPVGAFPTDRLQIPHVVKFGHLAAQGIGPVSG